MADGASGGAEPRLALCIPAWNEEARLPRLLESARRQSSPFDEVLVHDDASTDGTSAVAGTFGARVIRSAVNRGPSAGKNALAREARSDWLHFHDADGVLRPDFAARARAWARRDDVDVVLFGTEDRDDVTGAELGRRTWDDRALRADAVRYCILNTITNCGAYRRPAFMAAGGFDGSEDTKYNEDQAMHLRLALHGLRFRADDYPGIVIYRRPNSMSAGHPIECARAGYHVMRDVAGRTGTRYAREIGARLWRLAAVSGTYRDWDYVRRCLQLAERLGCRDPEEEDRVFRLLARLHPFGAVALRERLVRWFKPELRSGVPTAS